MSKTITHADLMVEQFTVGSLFAGIGGFELGLEATGRFRTIWQVEIDEYARQVLKKHWPDVRRWDDVKTFPPEPVDDWRCDVICGGFPCQDISFAGKGAGLDGDRSGLWYEFARVVGVVRPRFVLVENVAALLSRGLDAVLGTLASLGYDAEWHCVPAAYVGAPHIRDRVWILAHAASPGSRSSGGDVGDQGRRPAGARQTSVPPPARRPTGVTIPDAQSTGVVPPHPEQMGRPTGSGEPGNEEETQGRRGESAGSGEELAGAVRVSSCIDCGEDWCNWHRTHLADCGCTDPWDDDPGNPEFGWWATEPNVGRVAHGVPSRVHRLRCLGNAVVPQVAEFIGQRLLEMIDAETEVM